MKAILDFPVAENTGYIANPYWPEISWLITLEQDAGVHPKHGDDKRKQLIESYCQDNGIAPAKVAAARLKIEREKWYKNADGEIYIPRHQLAGALVQALSRLIR